MFFDQCTNPIGAIVNKSLYFIVDFLNDGKMHKYLVGGVGVGFLELSFRVPHVANRVTHTEFGDDGVC